MTLAKNKKVIVLFFITLLLTIIVGTAIGSTYINILDVLKVFSNNILKTSFSVSDSTNAIIWKLRFPRVLLAVIVGASLACSGVAIQSVLKNPLASPYTLGVSSGASLGVALVILLGLQIGILGNFLLPVIGFAFGIITVLVIITIANKLDTNLSTNTIVLVGMVSSLFVNSVLTMVIALSGENMNQIIRWQMGSLSLKGWDFLIAVVPFFIIGFIGILYYYREMDALSFGDTQAMSLGVDTKKVKRRLLVFATILTGSAVAVSGTIGFIGLITPHIIRRIVGSSHIVVILLSAMFGAVFLVVADLISRTTMELPVGAITALIGAPIFIYVYFIRKKV